MDSNFGLCISLVIVSFGSLHSVHCNYRCSILITPYRPAVIEHEDRVVDGLLCSLEASNCIHGGGGPTRCPLVFVSAVLLVLETQDHDDQK